MRYFTETFDLYMERVEITYYDQVYVKNASTTVRRYSRKSNPVLNIYGYIEKAWDKNVSIALVIEEYLHNEYRPSFVRFQFKLCDLFDSPLLDLKKNYGLECPLPPAFLASIERVEVPYYDNVYTTNLTATVRRYSRKGKPTLNVYGTALRTLDNNLSASVVIEEFLHNEYRPSFIELKFKLCDLFSSPFFTFGNQMKCPMPPILQKKTGSENLQQIDRDIKVVSVGVVSGA
ncbi:unnamed protein product [Colias eurytheme]|nr:unnamed protein product [Colias eurytheme]